MLGELISAGLDFIGGERRNRQQDRAAQQQMAFQERMSSTAYQRAMQDMREAGLNPMLAAKLGGASSPVGAMPQFANTFGDAVRTYSTAYQAETARRQQEESAQLTRAQANMVDKTSEKIIAETTNIRNQAEVIVQTGLNLKELVKKTGQEARTSAAYEETLVKQLSLIAEQIKDTNAAAALKQADVNFINKLEKQFGAGGNQVTNALGILIRLLNR